MTQRSKKTFSVQKTRHLKTPSKLLKQRRVARLLGKQLVLVMFPMFQVLDLFYNKLSGVAIVTELVMVQVCRKERKVVLLSTRSVAAVNEKGTSELFVNPNPEAKAPMKLNLLMLMKLQLLLLAILTTPTTSVYPAKEEQ